MSKRLKKWFLPPWVHRHLKKRERREALRRRLPRLASAVRKARHVLDPA